MMHLFKPTLLMLVFCLGSKTIAQTNERFPLTDAFMYMEYIGNNNVIQAKEIYNAYNVNPSNNLIPAIPDSLTPLAQGVSGVAPIDGSIQSDDGNSLGAPLINALSTVIAKRFKEELTIAFLENFRDKLEKVPYLAALFPNAKVVMLHEDIFNLDLWLTTLRAALDEDLRSLPDNMVFLLEEIRDGENITDENKTKLNFLIAVYTPAVAFVKAPQETYSVVLGILESIKGQDILNDNGKASLVFSYYVLKELGNADYDDWAGELVLERLASEPEVIQTFVGFTLEKYKSELKKYQIISEQKDTTDLYSYFTGPKFNRLTEVVEFTSSIVRGVAEIYAATNVLIQKIRDNTKLDYSDYQALFTASIDVLERISGGEMSAIFNDTVDVKSPLKDFIKQIKPVRDFGVAINEHIDKKEYPKIMLSALKLVDQYLESSGARGSSAALEDFIQYANLAVSLSMAGNSEEMVEVIEAAALPIQSYRLKRSSPFSITLNAYAGIYAGVENLNESNVKNRTAGILGATAPIGVALNWGLRKKTPETVGNYGAKTTITEVKDDKGNVTDVIVEKDYFNGHSISLFASIVDVGALATFRLSDDQTPVDDIQWQNILAPGAYIMWGIGKTPLSLGLGAQYGPELRRVAAREGVAETEIDSRGWRFGLSFTVDIPLLQLYGKKERVVLK